MIRFICWVLALSLAIGFGPRLVTVTIAMAKSAILAHQHNQMSYAQFTRKLLNAKPRVIQKNQNDSDLSH